MMIRYLFLGIITMIFSCNTRSVQDNQQQDKVVEEIYLIPDNFIGTIDIYFDVEKGAEKEYQDSIKIFRIPESGILKTKFLYCKGTYLKESRKYYYINKYQRIELPMTMNIHADIEGIAVFKDFDIKENNKIIGERYYVDSLKYLDNYSNILEVNIKDKTTVEFNERRDYQIDSTFVNSNKTYNPIEYLEFIKTDFNNKSEVMVSHTN